MNSTWSRGFWRLADPKISLASCAAMGLGLASAAAQGPVHWGWFALTVVGVFALEVAKNASGEVVDWDRGVDQRVAPEHRSPFSGGKRVLVDGLLTRHQTLGIALAAYLAALVTGLVIVLFREPAALWYGVAGAGLAYFYHAPPLALAYRGWGEVAVAAAYGPLLCGGTYLVQRGTVSDTILLVSLPLGLLIGAFLWANEFPDYHADRAAGKRTLVVRLGRKRGGRVFVAIAAAAILLMLVLPLGPAPPGTLLGGMAIPPLVRAARILGAGPEQVAETVPAQARLLLAFLLYALGAGLGLVLGPP